MHALRIKLSLPLKQCVDRVSLDAQFLARLFTTMRNSFVLHFMSGMTRLLKVPLRPGPIVLPSKAF